MKLTLTTDDGLLIASWNIEKDFGDLSGSFPRSQMLSEIVSEWERANAPQMPEMGSVVRFRDIVKGQRFVFTSEDAEDFGGTRGPWVKFTHARFKHTDPAHRGPYGGYSVEDTRVKVRVVEGSE